MKLWERGMKLGHETEESRKTEGLKTGIFVLMCSVI